MAGLLSQLFSRTGEQRPFCAVVVPAAGSASRMKGIDKILTELDGVPVLIRALEPFQQSPRVDEIIVVTREELVKTIRALCAQHGLDKVREVVPGGKDRAESVLLGLCSASKKAELVAVHDGARPFLSQQVLEEVLTAAERTHAAAPAIPVVDTIKVAHNGVVERTPDRSTLFAVQTPQVFDRDLLLAALHKAREEGIPLTDDCSAAEAIGCPVTLTKGSRENIKITTPLDLALGEAILQCQKQH